MISEALKSNSTLTTLYLGGDENWRNEMNCMTWQREKKGKIIWTDNNIGESGARMISEALKSNRTLIELHLEGDENWRSLKKGNDCMTRLRDRTGEEEMKYEQITTSENQEQEW